MEKRKKDKNEDDKGISAKSYLFASEQDEEKSMFVLPKESETTSVAVQTESKKSVAIKLLLDEIEAIETIEECDTYWK